MTVYFQPILSMRGRALFGVEALIRSVTPGGEIIAPAQLFAAAIKEGKQLELDRAARRLAIHAFAPCGASTQGFCSLLTLNLS